MYDITSIHGGQKRPHVKKTACRTQQDVRDHVDASDALLHMVSHSTSDNADDMSFIYDARTGKMTRI